MSEVTSPAATSTPSRRHMKALSLSVSSKSLSHVNQMAKLDSSRSSLDYASPSARREMRLNLSRSQQQRSACESQPTSPCEETSSSEPPSHWRSSLDSSQGSTSRSSMDWQASPSPLHNTLRSGRISPSQSFTPTRSRRQGSVSYKVGSSPLDSPAQANAIQSPLLATSSASSSRPSTPISSVERSESPTVTVTEEKSSSLSARSASTLVEQHGDLLNFIAKKERKCLDLREELKRHEEELAILKRKWENIVARDQTASSRPNTPSSASDRAQQITPSPRNRTNHSARHSVSSPSPSSLLAKSAEGPTAEAAKRWVGGFVAGFSGMLEGMSSPQSPATDALGTLQEVEEDGETSEAETDVSTKRTSNASTTATSLAEDGYAPSMEHCPSGSSQSSARPQTPVSIADEWVQAQQLDRTPLASTSPGTDSVTFSAMQERQLQAEEERKQAELLKKHGRRKSTAFDMLGSWGSRFNDAMQSETIKNSRKAAMSALDTFEKTITEAIVLPSATTVKSEYRDVLPTFPNTSIIKERLTKSPTMNVSPKISPAQSSWDWSTEEADLGNSLNSASALPVLAPANAKDRIARARSLHTAKRTSLPPVPIDEEPAEVDNWNW